VVEARRFPTSTAFASYRMGSRAAAANYYALQLSVEQKVTGQNISTEASESGTVVYLTVLSGGRVMDQVSYTMGGRGTARQIDFGNVDNDNDGLPDGWEQAYLYGLESGPEDDPGTQSLGDGCPAPGRHQSCGWAPDHSGGLRLLHGLAKRHQPMEPDFGQRNHSGSGSGPDSGGICDACHLHLGAG